jgi:hypothetical protein
MKGGNEVFVLGGLLAVLPAHQHNFGVNVALLEPIASAVCRRA